MRRIYTIVQSAIDKYSAVIPTAALVLYAASGPISSLVISVAAARVLGTSSFGAVALIWATVQTFASVGQLSLSFAVTRFAAQLAARDPVGAAKMIWRCLRWALLGAAIVFVLLMFGADFIAVTMLDNATLIPGLQLASIVAALVICTAVLGAGISGLPSPLMVATSAASQLLLPIVLAVIGAVAYGLMGILAGLCVAYAFRLLLDMWMLRRWQMAHDDGQHVSQQDGRALFNFAAPNLISGLITPLARWLSLALVGATATGLHAVALFTVANNLRNIVSFVHMIIFQIFTVRVNQAVGAGKSDMARSLIRVGFIMTVVATVCAGVVIAAFGSSALTGIFGEDYAGALPALRFLLVAGVLDAAASAVYQHVVVAGTMWRALFFITVPREIVLLLIVVFVGGSHPTELTLALGHVAVAAMSFISTVWVARQSSPLARAETT